MRKYNVQIIADKYPTDYVVEGSSWGTAISRAVREWKKRFKGSRTESLRIVATKGNEIIKKVEQN